MAGNALAIRNDFAIAVPRAVDAPPASTVVIRAEVSSPSALGFGEARILAAAAARYSCASWCVRGERWADARDIFGMMALGVEPGDRISILALGEGAGELIREMSGLVAGGFGIKDHEWQAKA